MQPGPLGQKARIATIPAPIGGLNGRDPVSAMPAQDAVALVNMIPGATGVQMRGGSTLRKAASGTEIKALMPYTPPSGTNKLFAAYGTGIYDATSAGAFGSPVVSGLTSAAWQSVNFGTPGGNFLIAANGADAPQKFDGTTWSAIAFATTSGYPYTLTPANMTAPCVYGFRLWFIEKNSLRVWYFPVSAIGTTSSTTFTAANVLDFSPLCKFGGTLVAMATWTHVTTYTITNFAVFLTSFGEVFVYSGPDPTIATGSTPWTLVGVYRLAPPIGNRCVIQYGADLGILTEQGIIPLSSILSVPISAEDTVAISDKIRSTFRAAYDANPNAFGWQLSEYPKGALLICNVPNSDGSFGQFVMNADTQAWCQFSGLNATCWGLLGDNLYFGDASGAVWQYDTGSDDNGAPIEAVILPAFSALKSPLRKRVLLARPLYTGALGYKPAMSVRVDYDISTPMLPQGTIPPKSPPWGSPWGTLWSAPSGASNRWQSARGLGQTISVLVNVAALTPFRLDHVDISYELGGYF